MLVVVVVVVLGGGGGEATSASTLLLLTSGFHPHTRMLPLHAPHIHIHTHLDDSARHGRSHRAQHCQVSALANRLLANRLHSGDEVWG